MIDVVRTLRHGVSVVALLLGVVACGGGGGDETAAGGAALAGSPVIAIQPVAATVDDGARVSFTVGASGDAPITYQWSRDGVDIAGATAATLSLAVSYADSGASFRAVAGNAAGRATSDAARLTVRPLLPTVVAQPAPVTSTAGGTATFSVATSGGTQPLAYQWQRNGTDLPGATAVSYTTSALTADDAGAVYGVVIRNAAGTVTSATAALAIGAAADGVLTLTGAGAAGAGGGGTFVPNGQPVVQTMAPSCAGATCTSVLSIVWTESSGESLVVLLSSTAASPGVAAGSGVNGFNLAYSVSFANGASLFCSPAIAGCDFAALGITFDGTQRRLTFVDTPVASGGVANVVLNGSLRY